MINERRSFDCLIPFKPLTVLSLLICIKVVSDFQSEYIYAK